MLPQLQPHAPHTAIKTDGHCVSGHYFGSRFCTLGLWSPKSELFKQLFFKNHALTPLRNRQALDPTFWSLEPESTALSTRHLYNGPCTSKGAPEVLMDPRGLARDGQAAARLQSRLRGAGDGMARCTGGEKPSAHTSARTHSTRQLARARESAHGHAGVRMLPRAHAHTRASPQRSDSHPLQQNGNEQSLT